MLDMNPKYLRDQDRDCSRRNDPVYIGRVVSAMVSPQHPTFPGVQTPPGYSSGATASAIPSSYTVFLL